jgi:hypothetical protein
MKIGKRFSPESREQSFTKNGNTAAHGGRVLSRLQARLDVRRRPLRTGLRRLRLNWVAAKV